MQSESVGKRRAVHTQLIICSLVIGWLMSEHIFEHKIKYNLKFNKLLSVLCSTVLLKDIQTAEAVKHDMQHVSSNKPCVGPHNSTEINFYLIHILLIKIQH